MISNPYFAGDVITDRNKFVGREKILQLIASDLLTQQKIVLYGQRRVGKSSILHKLYEERLGESDLLVPVNIDMVTLLNKPLKEITVSIARTVRSNLGLSALSKDLGINPPEYFRNVWLPTALDHLQGNGLVLLLDEFDNTSQSAPTRNANEFYDYLSGILHDFSFVKIVVVLARSPENLIQSARNLLSESVKYRIPLMSKDEIYFLTSLSDDQIDWEQEAREEVWQLTKGHPFLAQSLCSTIWGRYSKFSKKKTIINREKVEKSLIAEGYDHIISHSWHILSSQEQVIVAILASAQESGYSRSSIWNLLQQKGISEYYLQPDMEDQNNFRAEFLKIYENNPEYFYALLNDLEKEDWVEIDRDNYKIKIPMFGNWVKDIPFDHLVEQIFNKSKRSDALFVRASLSDNDRESIQLLEWSLQNNPENQKAQDAIVDKLKDFINVCLQGQNYRLAISYAEKLSKFQPELANKYIRIAKVQSLKLIVQKSVDINVFENNFREARLQANRIRLIDVDLYNRLNWIIDQAQIRRVLFVASETMMHWLWQIVYWLALPTIIWFLQSQFSQKLADFSDLSTGWLVIIFLASVFSALIQATQTNGTSIFLYAIVTILGIVFVIYPQIQNISVDIVGKWFLVAVPLTPLVLMLIVGESANLLFIVGMLDLFVWWVCFWGGLNLFAN